MQVFDKFISHGISSQASETKSVRAQDPLWALFIPVKKGGFDLCLPNNLFGDLYSLTNTY